MNEKTYPAKQVVVNIAEWYAKNPDAAMMFNVFKHYQPVYKKYKA